MVVLDVGLPDLDGWQVLQRIRQGSTVPVLMLTGHADEPDKVRGLRGGADDYLTKPFGIDEFTARVEALLRRGHREPIPTADVFVDGDLYVDFDRREVRSAGEEIALTPIEFKLLAALVHPPGQVISSDELLRLAWDDGSGVASDRVKFSVHRLRRKLGWERSGELADRGRAGGWLPLPARRAGLAAADRNQTATDRRPGGRQRAQGLTTMGLAGTTVPNKILVVEDDPAIARVLSRLLTRIGCAVVQAADGSEGMGAFDRETPDLVVLDLGLPVSTGGACSATSGAPARSPWSS